MSDDKNLRENEQPENKRTQRSAPLESEALEPRILLSATWVDADDGADEVDVPDGSEGLEGDELVVEEGAGDDLLDDGGDDLLGDVPVEEEAPAISASIGDRVEVPLVHDAGPMPDWLESTNPGIEDDALAMESGQTVTLTWEGESAGYQSTLGYYIYDDAGNITDVDVLWPNASSEGSGGDLVVGESQVEFEVAAGDNVGFFNIANGFSDADNRAVFEGDDGGQYEFRDAGGDPATRDSAAPSLVFVDAEGAETTLEGNIYHSTADGENVQLNPDEMTHVRSGAGPAGEMHIHLGFEDLYGGGDEDYDDLNFSLTFTPQETASGYELDIDLSGAGDPETLSAVTLGGLPDGASLSAGTDNGDGTWTIQQSELEGLAVLMDGPADFELSLSVNSADGDEVTNSSETVAIDMSPWDGDVADGDLFVHDGGVDSPVVDLTDYSSDDVTFEYGRMTVELPDGGSFTVEFQDVDSVEFSDGSVGLFVWDAGADDADSSSALNWQNDQTPGPNDILIFHGDVDVSAEIDAGSVGGILVGDGYSGRIILEQPTEIGQLDLGSGRLEAGSHDLTVHGDIHVDGGQLNAQDLVAEGDLVVTSGDLDVDRLQLAGDADQVLQPGTEYLENVTVEKTGGTLTLSGPIELRGDFTHVSGAVDAGDSTVEVRGGSLTLATGDIAFNDFVFDNGSTVTIQGELLVDGDLTVERVRYLNGGEIHVGGDVTTTDTSVYGSSVFVLDGSGDQTIDAAGGMGELSAVTIDKPDGTLTFTDHVQLSGDFTHVAGEVVTTGATIEIQGGNLTIDAGTVAFDDLVLNNGSRITVEGELVVEGDLTIERVRYLNGGEVHVAGDVTTKDTSVYGSSVFVLDGSGDQTIDAAGGMGELSAVTIDKPDGTLTFTDHVQLSGDFTHVAGEVVTTDATIEIQGGNLTVAAGDVTFDDLVLNNGSRVTIDGELTVEGDLTIERAHYLSGGELHVAGDVTTKDTSVYGDAVFVLDGSGDQTIDAAGGMGELSAVTIDKPDGTLTFTDHVQLSGDFTHVAGEVVTTDATIEIQGGNLTVAAGDVTFDDLVLNNGSRVTIDGELTVEGDLTIERAHYLSGGELHVAGDVTTKDTSVYGDAVFVLDGSGDQTIDAAGGMGELSAVTIDKPDGTLTFTDHVQLSGDFTHVAGDVVTTGATIEIQGGNLTVAAGDVTFDDLVLNNGSRVTIDGELTVEGDLTIERAHYLSGGELHVAGDVTTKDTSVYGDAVLVLDGSGDQTIDAAGGMGELSAVTIDKPDGTLTFTDHVQLSGDFTHVAGEVVTTGATIEIQGGNLTVAAGDVTFDDLVLNNGSRVTIDGELTVEGDLTIERAHYLSGGELHVAGDVTTKDTSVYGDSVLVLDGSGDQTIDAAGGMGELSAVTIDKPDGTLTFTDHVQLSGDFTHVAGEVVTTGSTVEIQGGNVTIAAGDVAFDDLVLENGSRVTLDGDLVVDGDLTIERAHYLNGGDLRVAGDVTGLDSSVYGDSGLVLTGDSAVVDVAGSFDTIRFEDVTPDAVYTITGSGGWDTLDLSEYSRDEVGDDGSSLVVDMGGDESFTVNYTSVEEILINDPPVVEAGVDQTVDEGALVTLDGAASDAEGDELTYTWVQTGGPTVVLSDVHAQTPTFEAPDQLANTELTFELEVSDGRTERSDSVTVTVQADDDAPMAEAGPAQTVEEGEVVTLTGSGTDPEGEGLTFTWVQTGGPAVELDDPSAASPTFTAPDELANTDVVFQLQVSDGTQASLDTVTVTVNADDDAPSADAGPPQLVTEGDVVALSGSGSDPEGQDLVFEWVQTGGPEVTLDDATAAAPVFEAPEGVTAEELTFELHVTDGETTTVDTVAILVEADDDPPTAQAGAPAEAVGGDVVRLEGTGSDPEGRDLTYSWVQIGGAPVELDDPAAASPSFHVPDDAGMDGEPIRFELTVSDGESASVDAVDIVVTPNPVAVAQPEPEPQPEVESEPENVDSSPETGAGALAGAPTSSPDGSSVDEDGLPGTRAEIYDELFLDQDSGDAEARELGDVEDAPSLLPASDSDAAAQRPNMSALFREVVDFGSEGRADVGTPIQLPTQLGEGDFTSLFAEVGVVDSALQAEAEEASREDGSGDASNREARPEVSEVDREEAGTERNERKAGGFFAGLFSLVRGVAGSSTSSNRSSSEDEKK